MIRQRISICDLYVLLYILYVLQGMYVKTSMAAMSTLIPMLLLTLYFLFYSIFKYSNRPRYINALIVFILLLSIYGLFNWVKGEYYGDVKPISFLLSVYISLAPVMTFYAFTRLGKLTMSRLQIYFLLFVPLAILQYFNYFFMKEIDIISGAISNRTNNEGYIFTALLPLLFVFNNKKTLQYIFIIIILYFVMSAMKRGAIFVTGIYLIWFLLSQEKDKTRSKRITVFFRMAVVGAVIYIGNNVWSGNDYFVARIEQTAAGDVNHRDIIFRILWQHFINNNNLFELLFGIGAEGTQRLTGLHAHNDWLELLTDCGLVGVIIYAVYFLCLFSDCHLYRKINPESKMILGCAIILFMRTWFSMSYMDMDLSMSMALGYGVAACEMKKKYNNIITL